jgi:glycosyltransferase involved in cell wall biosynthesis
MRFQACTIITRSYLAQARVLYGSFRKFHPEARFSALVFDAQRGAVDEAFEVFLLEDIGLPAGEETRMPMLYGITELATALKPWFFRHLLAGEPTPLLYFDPDIEIFAPVERLAQLAQEHCLVTTPHTTRPMSRGEVRPNETDILGAGAYNLGFLGLNPACDHFLDWWSERLLREAMIDPPNMRFTDQRWMDFAPGYFDTCILKDETCNIAYWNADSRPLRWTGARYEVNAQPLCFFHFSGFDPEKPHLLSVHQQSNPRTRLSEHPALARLCREYTQKLEAAGYPGWKEFSYRFDTAPGGLRITTPMRLAYRVALRKHEETGAPAPPNPFLEPAAFVAWLNEPLYPRRCPEITRYFWAIHQARPDLQAAFPNVKSTHHRAYYQWVREEGREQLGIPDQLMPRPDAIESIAMNSEESPASKRGVTLIGYLRAEVGTGEAGRLMAAAVEACGERNSHHILPTCSRQNHPWNGAALGSAAHYDTNLFCMNADQMAGFAEKVGPEFFNKRYNIGLWFWEAEIFPPHMHAGFNFLNEVWVTSEFTREAIAKVSRIPVFKIPQPLNIDGPQQAASLEPPLDLPDRFIFLFSFDFFSVVERKNPLGLIEAFQRAFVPGEGPVLLIKSINGHHNVAELERLHYARAGREDIIIHDGYLSHDQRDALVAACHCYVSLHRAEGFGLTIAEAMLQEKPAIATAYSGNLEFMTEANSFLCGYDLRPIGDGYDPYPSSARWAEPRLNEAVDLLRFVYKNPEEAKLRAKRGRADLASRHEPETAGKFIKKRLSQLRETAPTPVGFSMPAPERPAVSRVRSACEQGIDVRRTIPSLLTWIFRGPRRAMKRFLRDYDQHNRQIGLWTVDAISEIDRQLGRDRASLSKRVAAQEDDIHFLKQELKEARERLADLENPMAGRRPTVRLAPTVALHEERNEDPQFPEENGAA